MFRLSVFVTLVTLGGSALGFVVQLLLAQRFGVGVEVDAYLFALSVPTFIAGMLSAMLSYAVVPRLVACEEDTEYHRRYMGSLLLGVTAMSLLLAASVGGLLGALQGNVLPPDSPIRQYRDLPLLILLAWLIGACQIVQGCLAAMLNSVRSYLASAALGLLPYVGMVALLLAFDTSIGIAAVPAGMLAGTAGAVAGGVFLLRSHLFPLPWKRLLWPELRQLAYSSPYTAVAMSCFSSYAVVDAYWAPHAGQGALASLGYAQRLVIALGSFVVAGPSAVLVPRFADFVREHDYHGFLQFLLRALIVVGAIAAGVAILLAVFAERIIELLFSYGAFGHEEVAIVASTMRHMTPGMVAMLISVISMRAIFCLRGATKIAAIMGVIWVILYFIASFYFHVDGAVGLATGYSIVWFLFALSIGWVIFNVVKKNNNL